MIRKHELPILEYDDASPEVLRPNHYRFCPEQGSFLYSLNDQDDALQMGFCLQVRVEPENG